MTFTKILISIAVLIGLSSTGAYAKDNNATIAKTKAKFIKKIGSKKDKLDAKEIKEGFVFKSGKGKVTLLTLWTKNCESCIADIPNVNQIMLDFRGKVNIISIEISGMSSTELQRFAKEKGVLYTLISGKENKNFVAAVMRKFDFKGSLPFTVVLGYTGHNNGIIKGVAKLPDMEKFIQKIIDHYEKKSKK